MVPSSGTFLVKLPHRSGVELGITISREFRAGTLVGTLEAGIGAPAAPGVTGPDPASVPLLHLG